MPNTNCLDGMRCPKCGSEEPFRIAVQTIMTVYDTGTEEQEDTEWEDDSYCSCKKCEWEGTVLSFQIAEQEKRKVIETPFLDLPLLMGTMTTDEGKKALERRIKQ